MAHRNISSFETIVALSTPVTSLANKICMSSKVEIQTMQNYAILAALLKNRRYFVKKALSGNWAEVFIWENVKSS